MGVGGHQTVQGLLESVVLLLQVQLLHVGGLGGQALEAGGQGQRPGGQQRNCVRGLQRHQLGQGRLGGLEAGQDVLHRLDGRGGGRGGGLSVLGAGGVTLLGAARAAGNI